MAIQSHVTKWINKIHYQSTTFVKCSKAVVTLAKEASAENVVVCRTTKTCRVLKTLANCALDPGSVGGEALEI
jgi:hypothetical protein